MKSIICFVILLGGCVQFEPGTSITGVERFSPELCLNLRTHFYEMGRAILHDVEAECKMSAEDSQIESNRLQDEESAPTKCDSQASSFVTVHDYNCMMESNSLNDMRACHWSTMTIGPDTLNKMIDYDSRLRTTYCMRK